MARRKVTKKTKTETKPEGQCCPFCNKVVPTIIITEDGSDLLVVSPRSRSANQDWRNINGREFDYNHAANRVPQEARQQVLGLLYKHYDGQQALIGGKVVPISIDLVTKAA